MLEQNKDNTNQLTIVIFLLFIYKNDYNKIIMMATLNKLTLCGRLSNLSKYETEQISSMKTD